MPSKPWAATRQVTPGKSQCPVSPDSYSEDLRKHFENHVFIRHRVEAPASTLDLPSRKEGEGSSKAQVTEDKQTPVSAEGCVCPGPQLSAHGL